jgi:hypothetical protein
VQVKPKGSHATPKSYLASNQMSARVVAILAPVPALPEEPEKPAIPPQAILPPERPQEHVVPPPEPVETPKPSPAPPIAPEVPQVHDLPPPEPVEETPTPLPVPPIVPEEQARPVVPPVRPVPPPAPPKPEPHMERYIELGNMEFPKIVDTHRITGNTGMTILDAETAEYTTSSHVYAQAFRVETPMTVRDVSLAMHKFGGDGTIYVDLVADDGGKPGLSGFRSLPIFLDGLVRKAGYDWVTFSLPEGKAAPRLEKGKYWIVLRHSGEAVMTWFYIPGKPYSGADDTRSTLKGHLWEDILTYDFVFKIGGMG